MDKLIEMQSIIITLDVDGFLFDKIDLIAQAGFSLIEINATDAKVYQKAMQDFPKLRFGASNVISSRQLTDCHQAGVDFITSPGFLPTLVQTADMYAINYLPGISTISEAMQAVDMGCHHVRIFPANLSLCSLLNKYFPLLRLFPAEIEAEQVEHFLNLPAVSAVSILNPDIKQLQHFSVDARVC